MRTSAFSPGRLFTRPWFSTSDDGVYVLIEGTLWFRSLPDPGC